MARESHAIANRSYFNFISILNMNMLLGFLPFVAFALLSAAGYSTLGLLAGAVIAGATILRDAITPGKRPKMLDIGTCVLFGALTIVAWATTMDLSMALVRLCVDTGLCVIVLVTIVIGKPFSLEYAKESVPSSKWNDPRFIATNRAISGAWAAAFAVAAVADVALWRHALPARLVAILILGALYAAFRFTRWYSHHRRQQAIKQL